MSEKAPREWSLLDTPKALGRLALVEPLTTLWTSLKKTRDSIYDVVDLNDILDDGRITYADIEKIFANAACRVKEVLEDGAARSKQVIDKHVPKKSGDWLSTRPFVRLACRISQATHWGLSLIPQLAEWIIRDGPSTPPPEEPPAGDDSAPAPA